MASNNDNVMSRFLFAILQQKNLKDIDWNQVACNPILTQPITNGHAARMRYSRFKQSILGHEPQRRNRNPNKSKVTKSRKEPKGGKKEKEKEEQQVKSDPYAAPDARQQDSKSEAHQIKNGALVKTEAEQPGTDARLTPADLPPMSMADAQIQFQNRLLTPCSDTDMFGSAHHGLTSSPVSDLHHDQTFDYTGTTGHCAGHGSSSWHPSPSYSPYLHQFDMEDYSAPPAFCGGHQHSPHPEHFAIELSAMMAPDPSHVPVKHEEWDSRIRP